MTEQVHGAQRTRVPDVHLVRLGTPSSGDTVHRSTCPVAQTPNALRWVWADSNPDENWKLTAPWLRACKRCDPPSPLHQEEDVRPAYRAEHYDVQDKVVIVGVYDIGMGHAVVFDGGAFRDVERLNSFITSLETARDHLEKLEANHA